MTTVIELGTVLASIGDSLEAISADVNRSIERLNAERAAAIADINTRYDNMLSMLNQYAEAIDKLQGVETLPTNR